MHAALQRLHRFETDGDLLVVERRGDELRALERGAEWMPGIERDELCDRATAVARILRLELRNQLRDSNGFLLLVHRAECRRRAGGAAVCAHRDSGQQQPEQHRDHGGHSFS